MDNIENYNKCEYEIMSANSKSNVIERMKDLQKENIEILLDLSDDI